ncbi:MAG: VPLPA-CTERM sorting domain-containing protein [Pseudomonadales bacterium]|nr:VPLPA-CTERM sorting domain-containing protein [Pseudomonadales bacterium]
MVLKNIIRAACTYSVIASFNVNAALISSVSGATVYDTDLDISWLSDANLALSNTFGITTGIDVDGGMIYSVAESYIDAMNADNYLGSNTWRLSFTPDHDTSCDDQFALKDFGLNCSGNEMGHLFYNELGGTATENINTTGDPDQLAKFTNISGLEYWSTDAPDPAAITPPGSAFTFEFGSGFTGTGDQLTKTYFVWAVSDGDIAGVSAVPVPVPATAWLFGSGLLGLVSVARRRKSPRGRSNVPG